MLASPKESLFHSREIDCIFIPNFYFILLLIFHRKLINLFPVFTSFYESLPGIIWFRSIVKMSLNDREEAASIAASICGFIFLTFLITILCLMRRRRRIKRLYICPRCGQAYTGYHNCLMIQPNTVLNLYNPEYPL